VIVDILDCHGYFLSLPRLAVYFSMLLPHGPACKASGLGEP
jgi:hypothetical protein